MRRNSLLLITLVQLATVPAGFADTLESFGTTRIYGSIDHQGIPKFTDIPPVDTLPSPGIESSGKPPLRSRARPEISRHHATENVPPLHFDEPHIAQIADATPPNLRDGGAPPEDH